MNVNRSIFYTVTWGVDRSHVGNNTAVFNRLRDANAFTEALPHCHRVWRHEAKHTGLNEDWECRLLRSFDRDNNLPCYEDGHEILKRLRRGE